MKNQEFENLLPFILKWENVARYENGKVLICDRRKYPFEKVFHVCENVEGVAQAIETMVTQGGGPWIAASYAMVMAAREVAGKATDVVLDHLEKAKSRLMNTRPTNTALILILEKLTTVANDASIAGEPIEQAIIQAINDKRADDVQDYLKRARYGADLISDGDGILTMCFAETSFIMALALAKQDGKRFQVFTPETRPYLQGARLTAPCIHEMDIPVSVIGDSMPAFLMSQGRIQIYFTAADVITLDGHVVNKIGTFPNAIAANYHDIPYYAFMWGTDPNSPDKASIMIEERDPSEMKACMGKPTTSAEIGALYPAFDITPPHLVSGIITSQGILSPYDLQQLTQ